MHISQSFTRIDLEYFFFTFLFSSSFAIMGVYTSRYEVITELTTASEINLAETENQLASISGGFQS